MAKGPAAAFPGAAGRPVGALGICF